MVFLLLSLSDRLVYGELLFYVGNEMLGSSSCQSTCDYHPRPTETLYVGGNVTLKCLIHLDNTVDTSVTVAVVWSASDEMAINNTSSHVVSPVTGLQLVAVWFWDIRFIQLLGWLLG